MIWNANHLVDWIHLVQNVHVYVLNSFLFLSMILFLTLCPTSFLSPKPVASGSRNVNCIALVLPKYIQRVSPLLILALNNKQSPSHVIHLVHFLCSISNIHSVLSLFTGYFDNNEMGESRCRLDFPWLKLSNEWSTVIHSNRRNILHYDKMSVHIDEYSLEYNY